MDNGDLDNFIQAYKSLKKPIDTNTFVPLESRAQDIYMHLKNNGFSVYWPAQKVGECTEPYIVVKNDGGYRHVSFSSNRDMYSIQCYVPKDSYSKLEPMVQRVKRVMYDLYPMIQYPQLIFHYLKQ